jgi:uncharacterized delta-60 repeat protein
MKLYKIAWLLVCCLLIHDPSEAADGQLDTSFHSPDGYVLWDGGSGYDRGRDVALQQDGKIVVTGYMTNGSNNDLMVLRFDPNGTLDTDFGTNGVYIYDGRNGNDVAYSIAVQSDDKILVAGYSSNGIDNDIIVLRLDTDGNPDPNFALNGIYIYDYNNSNDSATDLAVQTDGKIVICGSSSNGIDSDMLVMRLTAEGLLDTTFNTDGTTMLDGGNGHDFASRLAIQPNHSIVVTGSSYNGLDDDTIVARFDANGVPDQTFGDNGIVLLDGGDYDRGSGVGIDSQGNILVTGLRTKPGLEYTDYDIPVFRLDPNGVPDTSFGNNGMALYDSGDREECHDLIVQCDDSVLMAGHSGTSKGSISDWALVVLKYDPNGILDTTFGNQGLYSYDPTENTEWGYGMALQPDGKIVVTGQAHNGIDDDVILIRLQNNPCNVNEPNEPNLPDGII